MFVALVNAVIWCAITGWVFPGFFWEMVSFWLVVVAVLFAKGVGFWETRVISSDDSQDIDVTINGKRYSGTIHKKDD